MHFLILGDHITEQETLVLHFSLSLHLSCYITNLAWILYTASFVHTTIFVLNISNILARWYNSKATYTIELHCVTKTRLKNSHNLNARNTLLRRLQQ